MSSGLRDHLKFRYFDITQRVMPSSAFFVMVRAGKAYWKIWRLVSNFFARIIRFTVQKFQLFWVIFCIIIFFIELWHILILWLAKMPNGGMPVFTLIATRWRYRKIFFYKKSTDAKWLKMMQHCSDMLSSIHSDGRSNI